MKTLEELFSFETSQQEMSNFFKTIANTYNKDNGYNSIPKEYYPYCFKLLSYRKYDGRSLYKENDIRTFFVGKMQGNNCIMFFDKKGNCDSIGITHAVQQWQKEKENFWDYKKDKVLQVLRNIAGVAVEKFKKTITLPVKDDISGELIYDMKDVHIDHYESDFSKVAYDWLYEIKQIQEKYYKRPIDAINVMYKSIDKDNQYFECRETSLDFYKYHNEHTHLRVTTKNNNLSREKYKPHWEYLKANGKYLEQYDNEKKLNK